MIFRFSVYTRLLVLARKMSRSLISIDESLQILARCAQSDWEARNAPKPRAKKSEFGTVDLGTIEEEYRKSRIEQGLEAEPDQLG